MATSENGKTVLTAEEACQGKELGVMRYVLHISLALAVWAVSHAKDQVTAHQLEVAAAATGGLHVSTWKERTLEREIDDIGGEGCGFVGHVFVPWT